MPLKHATETFLVILLGAAIAVTGLLIATLPALPAGGLPWGILFGAAVLYPAALTPLFRERRADTVFRWLHGFPALMLLLWFAIEGMSLSIPQIGRLQPLYVWGWTLPLVTVGFLGLLMYCWSVLRRRGPRMLLLLALFVPYCVGGVLSAQGRRWEGDLAAVLWRGDWWQVFGPGAAIPAGHRDLVRGTGSGTGEKNLPLSEDLGEESWRERLRVAEQRSARASERIALRRSSSPVGGSGVAGSSSSSPQWMQASSRPAHLPTSGGPLEMLAVTILALYTGTLHHRARQRGT